MLSKMPYYDVFLGYADEDYDIVRDFIILEHVRNKLRDYKLFIEGRVSVRSEVVIGIPNSKMAVFLLSQNFIKSNECECYLSMAFSRINENKLPKSCLLLVKITTVSTELPDIIKHALTHYKCLDYHSKNFWRDIRKAIDNCMKELSKVP